jgi:hypothetical protein
MAYKKVWKKGKVDWGAAMSNAAKKSAVQARKRKRAAETARRKEARAAEAARKRRAKEAERDRKRSAREHAKRVREREKAAAATAKAAERARIADEKQRQKLLAQEKKEREKYEKELLILKGRFLEHDVPLKLFGVDLRVVAHDYNQENGLTTSSQFKKVTVPYLEENLFKLAITNHIHDTFDLLYESELKEVATSPEIANHSKIEVFKSKCKISIQDALPKNLSFDDFSGFEDPINTEVISEYIETNIAPLVPEIAADIAADIKKQEEEAKQRAKEKKEHDDGCKEVMALFDKAIDKAVKTGKTMKTQIDKMNSDLEVLDKNHKSSWFGKKKFAEEAQALGSVIWKRTPGLIATIQATELLTKLLKNRIESSYSDIHDNPKVNQTLEENGYYEKTLGRFKKLYGALYKNLEMRLANLEKALSYYEDEKVLKAMERVKNEGLKLSKDSKNLNKIFNEFGGKYAK